MPFKKLFKIIGWILLGFIAVIVTYLLSAFVLSVINTPKEPGTSNDVAIYIMTNGDHTDIVLPLKNQLKDWSHEIKFENTISGDTSGKYVAIGWGNKDFYINTPTWAQLKFSTALKAVIGMGTSAIHATFYTNIHEDDQCKKIMISNSQYSRLVAYVDSSFKRDARGDVINIKTKANYDNNDAFYDATGTYDLFYTCNTWANNALKACGQKACVWTPFDKGIFYHYR